MPHPHFDQILAELRQHHRSPDHSSAPEDLSALATDLGLSPGPAQLLHLQQHWNHLRQTVRTSSPPGSSNLLRPLLLELAHDALLTLLLLEDQSTSQRSPLQIARRSPDG